MDDVVVGCISDWLRSSERCWPFGFEPLPKNENGWLPVVVLNVLSSTHLTMEHHFDDRRLIHSPLSRQCLEPSSPDLWESRSETPKWCTAWDEMVTRFLRFWRLLCCLISWGGSQQRALVFVKWWLAQPVQSCQPPRQLAWFALSVPVKSRNEFFYNFLLFFLLFCVSLEIFTYFRDFKLLMETGWWKLTAGKRALYFRFFEGI